MKTTQKPVSLYIGAHIDDILIGAFSQLSTDSNTKIVLNTTNNQPDPTVYPDAYLDVSIESYPDVLKKDIQNVVQATGVETFVGFSVRDGDSFTVVDEIREKMNELLELYNPEKIIIPAYQGSHIDHEVIAALIPKLPYIQTAQPLVFEYGLYHKEKGAFVHNRIPDRPDSWKELSPALLQKKKKTLQGLQTKAADTRHFMSDRGESICLLTTRDYLKQPVEELLYRDTHQISFQSFVQTVITPYL